MTRRLLLLLSALTVLGLAGAGFAQGPGQPSARSPRQSPAARPPMRPATSRQPASRPPPRAPARGRVRCEATDNGAPASAVIELRRANDVVGSGSCASPIEVPAGTYDAVVTLDTALDRPSRRVAVTVPENGEALARASFETAILEVRFTYRREPTTGIASVRSGGREVGTLGSGVAGRLSAGTYEVVARHRTSERTYTVSLAPGSRRALRAEF